jgi:hypothetical protein
MTTPRIYADFNGLQSSSRTAGRLAVPLDTIGTLRDLTNAALRLYDGARLLLFDWSDEEEDLESKATAYYDAKTRVWIAELDADGVAHVPKRDRTPDARFLCLQCRTNLAVDASENAGLPRLTVCGHCGAPMNAATAPPPNR